MEVFEMGPLFEAVQMNHTLPDGKTFPDCLPRLPLETIRAEYEKFKNTPGFDLSDFILSHFDLPADNSADFKSDTNNSIEEHIHTLWPVLTREPDKAQGSLIPLPNAYIVPGGRFREVYYWDSYFTMLGLKVSGRWDMIENMVENFAYLLDTVGHIPNGNRTYYVGRSQPPFFALMVQLLRTWKGQNVLLRYLPHLEKEYAFWMHGGASLTKGSTAAHRAVRLLDGVLLNRHWDEHDTPRPESYKEDVETARASEQEDAIVYRHLRAAAESGWDFSSRWFKDGESLATIRTTDLVPVDLNGLLYFLEKTLAEAYGASGNAQKSNDFKQAADNRLAALNRYCWDEARGFYFDFDFILGVRTEHCTLAAVFPLFFGMASTEQAQKVAKMIEDQFLQTGGVATTLVFSGQQWDAPNGWAPLQWMAFKGLYQYGFTALANEIKSRWLRANQAIYQKTGKMTEKYNVYEQDLEAGGGEYPLQDGFGWTNGVYLALIEVGGL